MSRIWWRASVCPLLAVLALAGTVSRASADPSRPLWHGGDRVWLAEAGSAPIPSYSRQTKLACNVCHISFPQLTPFGRLFKLNGYTLTGIEMVKAAPGAEGASLSLDLIPPLSVMVVTSLTTTKRPMPDRQKSSVEFPEELSLFVGEAITPRIGTFLQMTYGSTDGTFGWDNADIRYANHATVASRPLIYGVTLNNNPTVQDVWNSTPVWGFPYIASSVAPAPQAATVVNGGLAQDVAGLGAYLFWDNTVYAELSGYRSAHQGGAHPADSTAANTLQGAAPYWRVALQRQLGPQTVEVGSFGMVTKLRPSGVSGVTNDLADVGLDAQYERPVPNGAVTAHASWIHERQRLFATLEEGGAEKAGNVLSTLRGDASVYLKGRYGATVGYFSTTGDADSKLFVPDRVTGSVTGRPDTRGVVLQLDVSPWLNTRFGVQQVLYTKFNGASSGYDGFGRSASANNTTYLSAWLVF